jgi:hypothetical protein
MFAWSPSDMPDIPREVTEHSLDIWAGSKPVKQRLCRFDEEKRRAIGEEIHKLLATGFIKEVLHPKWLANPMLVKKKMVNGEYVLITQASTKLVLSILSLYHALTK